MPYFTDSGLARASRTRSAIERIVELAWTLSVAGSSTRLATGSNEDSANCALRSIGMLSRFGVFNRPSV
ncbi:hypothetical protein D3C81_2168130 [compost metagenome]